MNKLKLLFNHIFNDKVEVKILLKLSAVFLSIFIFYLIANYFVVKNLSLNDIKEELKITAQKISNDFEFKNGKWNTNKYLSDLETPTDIPVYVYTLDGFLIDRQEIINGFLDTSSFEFASSFTSPKTITSPIGESWRVLSSKVTRGEKIVGTTLVAYFEPRDISEQEIDQILFQEIDFLKSKIKVNNGKIDISSIRLNEINPDISLEIVDSFNRNLISKGGPPAYIDKSYLQDVMQKKDFSTIQDKKTKINYLITDKEIYSDKELKGIVVVGKTLKEITQILNNLIFLSLLSGVGSIVIFLIVTAYVYRHDIKKLFIVETGKQNTILKEYSKISFGATSNKIIIDSVEIQIPFETKQQKMCNLFFHHPKKKWETDELVEKLVEEFVEGQQEKRRHTVYDCIMALNTKIKPYIGVELISHRAKFYFFNPSLLQKVTKS